MKVSYLAISLHTVGQTNTNDKLMIDIVTRSKNDTLTLRIRKRIIKLSRYVAQSSNLTLCCVVNQCALFQHQCVSVCHSLTDINVGLNQVQGHIPLCKIKSNFSLSPLAPLDSGT